MNDYAMTLLKKKLEMIVDRIEDLDWWLRTVIVLINDERQCRKKNLGLLESYEQKRRSFLEAKEELKRDAANLRAALTSLRNVKRGKLKRRFL